MDRGTFLTGLTTFSRPRWKENASGEIPLMIFSECRRLPVGVGMRPRLMPYRSLTLRFQQLTPDRAMFVYIET